MLKQILAQPQSDRFIAGKLWRFYAGTEPSEALTTTLAEEFRRHGQQFRPFLRTLFLAEEFYAPEVVRQQIKSPVQLLVTAGRRLERELPPPLAAADLFNGDVKFRTDFRSVYAGVLEGWLKTPSEPILGGQFAPLALAKS